MRRVSCLLLAKRSRPLRANHGLLYSVGMARGGQHAVLNTMQRRFIATILAEAPPSSTAIGSPKLSSNPSSITTSTFTVATTTGDFFDEPVTFLGEVHPSLSVSLNGIILAVCSKGQTCKGGHKQLGPLLQSIHSTAKELAELLRDIQANPSTFVPMAAVAAVGHLLIHANVQYVQSIDQLLAHTYTTKTNTNANAPSLLTLAQNAVVYNTDERLTTREQMHLQALNCLLQHNRKGALIILAKILQSCPGDGLALIMAIDLCSVLGDRKGALKIAGSVATYWQERYSVIQGSNIGIGIIAVGLAAGGRHAEAERLTLQALQHKNYEMSGGLASWALAHVMDAEGRVSEGISALAGNEGMENYEGCGLLFFESKLAAYGARYALDREETGGRTMSMRIYDNYFGNVLEYSGYTQKRPWSRPQKRAPTNLASDARKSVNSFFSSIFGTTPPETTANKNEITTKEPVVAELPEGSTNEEEMPPSLATIEDVLCWLPPPPMLLADATLILLKQTFNENIKYNDFRWQNLQNSWLTFMSVNDAPLPPNTAIICSILCDPESVHGMHGLQIEFARGLHLMGKLMGLDQVTEPTVDQEEWKKVVQLMTLGRDSLEFWEADMRLLTEKAFCIAAIKSGDTESMCVARSICSLSVTLRPNSPEEWIRYSMVLNALGDPIASENARSMGISMGYGQGNSL